MKKNKKNSQAVDLKNSQTEDLKNSQAVDMKTKKLQLAKVKINISTFAKNKVCSEKQKNDFTLTLKPKYLELCKTLGQDEVNSYLGFSDKIKTLETEKVEALENEIKQLFVKYADIFGVEKLQKLLF